MDEKSKFSIGENGRIINPEFEAAKKTIHAAHQKDKKRLFRENVLSITGKVSAVVVSAAVGVFGVVVKSPWAIGLGLVALGSSIALFKEKKSQEHELLETNEKLHNSLEKRMKTAEECNLFPEIPPEVKTLLNNERYYGDKPSNQPKMPKPQ